ncbi:hypothetical protein NFI96_016709 [Prochilodus magdalenae]|nr:hypothetical protein NFI96_016709 [Prochilodus magdalenae]
MGPCQQIWRHSSSLPMGHWMKDTLTDVHRTPDSSVMLNTEVLWNKALTDNNVRGIFCWLRHLATEGKKDYYCEECKVEKSWANFNCWLQHSVDLTKKELLTICFAQCEGLWMFLDQNSFTKVHLLIQKLKNLLSLACWGKTHAVSLQPTRISRLACGTSGVLGNTMIKWDCSNQDLYTLRQHILLGRLIQWWGFTGLLPQYPDAHELKQISQMWRQMDRTRSCLELRCDAEDKYRWSSLIQGIMTHMEKEHGPLWVSEDCAYQTYPPPSLQALLNLVLVPHIDINSVQAIIMYFVLDVANFLNCKDDLLESFCHTFIIPPSFSQQILGFWLLDHGFVLDSMELLLSPKAGSPLLSFHHQAVLRTLLRQGERQAALKYLYYTMPAMENIQDARLFVDVLLQNNRVSEAWMLLRQGQPGNEQLLKHFICGCEKLCGDALATVCKVWGDMLYLRLTEKPDASKPESMNQENHGQLIENKTNVKGQAPRPLSALLYQCLINNSLTAGDVISLLGETVTALNSPQKATRDVVVWPKYLENTEENRNTSPSHQAFHPLPPSITPVELHEELQIQSEQQLLEEDLHVLTQEEHTFPSVVSSGSASPDSMTSACSFTSAPSSPPAANNEAPSRRGSILPLQNPFATPRDEDCHLQDDSQMSPEVLTPCCPELTLTVDGATETMSFKSLRRESAIELDIYESGVEEICAVPTNFSDPTETQVVEMMQTQKRSKSKFNLPPQCYSNEDNQAVPSTSDLPGDSHNFLTPDYEKIVYDKAVSEDIIKAENVIEELRDLPLEQGAEADSRQDCKSTETPESSSFLELKPLRRASSLLLDEECLDVCHHSSQVTVDQPEILTSCALSETMQELLGQIHERDVSVRKGEQSLLSSLASLQSSILKIDFKPKRRGSHTHQLQIPLGSSLSPYTSPTCSPQLSPSDQARDKAPSEGKTNVTKEAVCFRTTSDRVGHCKLGSWWKQALETRRASTGLLPAIEQIPAITKGLHFTRSQSQGAASFLDSSNKPKHGKLEIKQAVKEETSRRGSCKVACHAAEQGSASHRGQRGKRGKRFKRS